jgi:hypothetical protein
MSVYLDKRNNVPVPARLSRSNVLPYRLTDWAVDLWRPSVAKYQIVAAASTRLKGIIGQCTYGPYTPDLLGLFMPIGLFFRCLRITQHCTWAALLVTVSIWVGPSATPASGQSPSCPSSGFETFSGGGSAATEYVFSLAACQEATFTVTACDNSNYYASSLRLRVYGSGSNLLMDKTVMSPGADYCATAVIPSAGAQSGSPLPGTVGPGGHPTRMVVSGINLITYAVTVNKISEPGYNTGARDFGAAPLLSPLPAMVKARVQKFDDGQYFKVRVAAGGTLQLTGSATKTYCYQGYWA